MLDKVGWADALIAREDDDGNLHLIDGHLRADLAEDDEVPVLIVDLSEAEGDAVLATLDPIAALAGTDEAALSELLTELEFGPDVSEMLSQLADVPTNGDEVQHWQQRDVDFNSQEVDDGIEAVPRRLTFEFNEQERGWLLEAAALLQVRWELPDPRSSDPPRRDRGGLMWLYIPTSASAPASEDSTSELTSQQAERLSRSATWRREVTSAAVLATQMAAGALR